MTEKFIKQTKMVDFIGAIVPDKAEHMDDVDYCGSVCRDPNARVIVSNRVGAGLTVWISTRSTFETLGVGLTPKQALDIFYFGEPTKKSPCGDLVSKTSLLISRIDNLTQSISRRIIFVKT